MASANACIADFSKCAALSRRLFDNASLGAAMARGMKATLCAHGPTVLTNPHGRIQDGYPCPHVMTRTIYENCGSKKYFSLYNIV